MLPEDWSLVFPNGLNYNQADVNGKGTIDKKDWKAIMRDNYGLTHGEVEPLPFSPGNPLIDPVLQLIPRKEFVKAGEKLKVDLVLGDAARQVQDFFAIAFTLNYTSELVKDENENKLFKPKKVKLKLDDDSFIDPAGKVDPNVYARVNNEEGRADFVIMLDEFTTVDGFGDIGTIHIVMEDIVLNQTEDLELYVDKIKLINKFMEESPVASSAVDVTVIGGNGENSARLQKENSQDPLIHNAALLNPGTNDYSASSLIPLETTESTLLPERILPWSEQASSEKGLSVYPNPVVGQLWINTKDITESVRKMELYNRMGQLIYAQDGMEGAWKQSMDLSRFETGAYVLRVFTKDNVYNQLIILK